MQSLSSPPDSPNHWSSVSDALHAPGASVLAADIGGTHARLGQVGSTPDMPLLAYREYPCNGYADLGQIVQAFIDKHAVGPITHGVLACPGRYADGVVHNRNLPWPVAVSELRDGLGMTDLVVINDFEAVAHAVHYAEVTSILQLSRVSEPAQPGPQVIVGPGTGLGAAVLLPGERQPTVLATEAGQIGLSPGTPLEARIMQVLAGPDKQHVAWERVLSSPGLLNIYLALCAIESVTPSLASPRAVAEAGDDAQAARALDVFCNMLGGFTGDLAMLYGASGGIWLAGGVLPKLRKHLARSTFLERFIAKGCMSGFLETVPVHLLQHGQLGVTGAAGWYLDQARHGCHSANDHNDDGAMS